MSATTKCISIQILRQITYITIKGYILEDDLPSINFNFEDSDEYEGSISSEDNDSIREIYTQKKIEPLNVVSKPDAITVLNFAANIPTFTF